VPRFIKKPVEITAEQLTKEVVENYLWNGGKLPEGVRFSSAGHNPETKKVHDFFCRIDTLEGEMKGQMGDWVITGVQGERYFCKPDIFEATYEAVL
jgi:hypothetical protein